MIIIFYFFFSGKNENFLHENRFFKLNIKKLRNIYYEIFIVHLKKIYILILEKQKILILLFREFIFKLRNDSKKMKNIKHLPLLNIYFYFSKIENKNVINKLKEI